VSDDRRDFRRLPFEADVELEHRGREIEATLLDISLKGFLITVSDVDIDLEPGERVYSTIRLEDQGPEIQFDARAVHRQQSAIGFEWVEIDDDSFSHLRRLLELNFGDPEKIERELEELLGDS